MKKIFALLFLLCSLACITSGVYAQTTGSLKTLLKKAEKGNVDAQIAVGGMYLTGTNGVKRSESDGIYWLKKAAAKGSKTANELIAKYYVEKGDYLSAYDYDLWIALNKSIDDSKGGVQVALQQNGGKAVNVNNPFLNYTPAEEKSASAPIVSEKPQNNNQAVVSAPVTPEPIQIKQPKSAVDMNIAESGRVSPNTFALIIANEHYHSLVPVDYAANDGKIFSEYCSKNLGLPQENIKLYTDATYGTILKALKYIQTVGEAYEGDINLIVYYAGHGIPDEASRDAYVVPIDGDGTVIQSCIKVSDLYGRLASVKSKSTVVFMDACFSGSVRGDGMLASARGVAIASKPAKVGGNMVVISAAQGDETAYPLKSEGHGLFTYYLLKKLQETGGNVTLGEMSDYIIREVKRKSVTANGKIQTPSVLPSAIATDWRNWNL